MDLDDLLKEEDTDSPDFTAEEAASAIETVSEDDFVAKAADHLKGLITIGVSGRTQYQRKKFKGVNYEVLRLGDSKLVFKMAWLPR
jgi:hypothetical protein